MDRYTKTILTVIAGCLLVLVGNQIDFRQRLMRPKQGPDAEVSADGVAYYHDGRSLFACMYPAGCQKMR